MNPSDSLSPLQRSLSSCPPKVASHSHAPFPPGLLFIICVPALLWKSQTRSALFTAELPVPGMFDDCLLIKKIHNTCKGPAVQELDSEGVGVRMGAKVTGSNGRWDWATPRATLGVQVSLPSSGLPSAFPLWQKLGLGVFLPLQETVTQAHSIGPRHSKPGDQVGRD